MIINIDGKIGGGKTYFATHYLLKKYFQYDPVIDDWIPLKPLVLFTNIKGLKIDHIDLTEEIRKLGMAKVFSMEFVNEARRLYGCRIVLFVIDECQGPDYFHYRFKDPAVEIFFQTIRHGGVDCFLITQDIDNVARGIKTLAEYTIHTVARSFAGPGYFTYKKLIDGDQVKSMRVRKDPSVFRMYKSFSFEESEKIDLVWVRYVVWVLVLALGVYGGWNYMFKPLYLKKVTSPSKPAVVAPVRRGPIEHKDIPARPPVFNNMPVNGAVVPSVGVVAAAVSTPIQKAFDPLECAVKASVTVDGAVYETRQCGIDLYKFFNGKLVEQRKDHSFDGHGKSEESALAPERANGTPVKTASALPGARRGFLPP